MPVALGILRLFPVIANPTVVEGSVKDRLPNGVEWLLRIGLPADQREPIAGDLAEEYSARRRDDGSMRATAALWRQAAWLAWVFRWERTRAGT